jgi:hypothetical protein
VRGCGSEKRFLEFEVNHKVQASRGKPTDLLIELALYWSIEIQRAHIGECIDDASVENCHSTRDSALAAKMRNIYSGYGVRSRPAAVRNALGFDGVSKAVNNRRWVTERV